MSDGTSQKMKLLLATLPDRESVVAELWRDDAQFAEVALIAGELRVQLYPHPTSAVWDVGFDELQEALTTAARRLRGDG